MPTLPSPCASSADVLKCLLETYCSKDIMALVPYSFVLAFCTGFYSHLWFHIYLFFLVIISPFPMCSGFLFNSHISHFLIISWSSARNFRDLTWQTVGFTSTWFWALTCCILCLSKWITPALRNHSGPPEYLTVGKENNYHEKKSNIKDTLSVILKMNYQM